MDLRLLSTNSNSNFNSITLESNTDVRDTYWLFLMYFYLIPFPVHNMHWKINGFIDENTSTKCSFNVIYIFPNNNISFHLQWNTKQPSNSMENWRVEKNENTIDKRPSTSIEKIKISPWRLNV